MVTLRIEHAIRDYSSWKAAFDGDPVGRERLHVRSYRISQPVDDPKYVMIDLDFDSSTEAEALLNAMRRVWTSVEGVIMMNPQTRISEVLESKHYPNS